MGASEEEEADSEPDRAAAATINNLIDVNNVI